MKQIFLIVAAVVGFISISSCNRDVDYGAGELKIIPQPAQIAAQDGFFILNSSTELFSSGADLSNEETYLSNFTQKYLGYNLEIATSAPSKNAIIFEISDQNDQIGEEGYLLSVNLSVIKITARTTAGIFYGIQSLFQLLPPKVFKAANDSETRQVSIPSCDITDYPRFEYRGMHLDVSRHFFPKEFIYEYIDYLAAQT